ncbi:hypothetical protein AMK68_00170 [candidate division KD3-62 bacterium DG_56]|uniref:Uncharacterized protein n=1 Tax=candidate division KD3-62 bacterium DG_56 TaxID=1704032 RepID=A0A0S7XRK4_9BACT|nr:MAG: hypothetical protein AMK68_00170 [candidate division KD3-62 bacterium DG_56]
MALATWAVEFDLDEDGTFGTDISTYVHRMAGVSMQGRGRQVDLDAAGISTLTLTLGNDDGRFSPGNAGGPYGTKFRPLKRVRLKVTYNAVTYDFWYGVIKSIEVRPMARDRTVFLSCEDMMSVLAATEIRLPLMCDQRAGVIIHRLLDAAEVGEQCDNPRFRDDLTGYTDLGTVTNTRVTSGKLLEGGAALESVTTAATSGWIYAFPHDADADFQSRKVTRAVYVWATSSADVGETFTIRLRDNLGNRGTETVTLTEEPQRVEVSGTYAATATDFYVDGYMTSVAATFRTGAVHGVYAECAFPRDIDDGDHPLGNVSFPPTSALDAIQEVRDNEPGGLFFFDGAGQAVFHDQAHRWHETHSTVSQATIDETFTALSYTMDAADRISEIVLYFPRWETGEAGTIVFSLYPSPRTIPGNGSITVEIDHGGGLMRDTIVPVANEDFFAEFADGSDATGSLSIDLEDYGAAAVVTVSSSSANPIKLTALTLRATPVRSPSDMTPARASPTTMPALPCVVSHAYRFQDSERVVQSWADYLAARFGDVQRSRIALTIAEAFPDTPTTGHMATILGRAISDRITLSNDAYPFSAHITGGTFYIDGMSVAIGERHIAATWQLVPTDADMFILDSSELDGVHVLAP